jgi:hypothetical protein
MLLLLAVAFAVAAAAAAGAHLLEANVHYSTLVVLLPHACRSVHKHPVLR